MKKRPQISSQLIVWILLVKMTKTIRKNSPQRVRLRSPQRQKQPKKTSITPDLSKHICYQLFSLLSLLIPGKIGNSYIVVIVFLSLYREESCTESGRTQGVGQCKLTNKNVVLSTVIAKLIVW